MATKRNGPEVQEKDVSQKKKTKAEEKKSWSDEEVGDLIDLFESKPCLWNIPDPSYAKRDDSIAEQFETTIQAIKAKLNGLRTQFDREMSKCLKVRANRTTNKAEMLDENIGRFAPGLITQRELLVLINLISAAGTCQQILVHVQLFLNCFRLPLEKHLLPSNMVGYIYE